MGSITVLLTSEKPGLDMAVVDINKNSYIIRLGQVFGRLMVRNPSSYFYNEMSVPWLGSQTRNINNKHKHNGITRQQKNVEEPIKSNMSY